MKDASHHLRHIQKKVIQSVRKNEAEEAKNNSKSQLNFSNESIVIHRQSGL